jgi:RES domain-containing protein
MTLYHLEKAKYKTVWPPEGTLHAEGRWNRPGQWIIYTSPSIALAKLETLANSNGLPISRVCMTIEADDAEGIFEIPSEELPVDWLMKPYSTVLRRLTDGFISSGKLLMRVPSAQSYREFNYLINVRHGAFHRSVQLISTVDEPFDPRLK